MKLNKAQIAILLFSATITPVSSAFALDRLSDEWKEVSIASRINMNDVLEHYNVETEVKNNVAVLTGQVSSSVEKSLAEEIAKNVDGVVNVVNNISVDEAMLHGKRDTTLGQKISDATTTARVKSRLLWSSGVPGMNINVETNNGNVSLAGEVPLPSQKELAEKLASNTSGVRYVQNNIVATSEKRSKIGNINLNNVEKHAGEAISVAGDSISDTWIEAKVSTSLNFSRNLNIKDLSVKSKDGVVTLTGIAYHQADKELASEFAKDIRGVKSVVNLIKVL